MANRFIKKHQDQSVKPTVVMNRLSADIFNELEVWADSVGLETATISKLQDNSISSEKVLMALTDQDISELNLNIGQRTSLKLGIKE